MNIPHPQEKYLGPLLSKMGKAFPGERAVFRGKDLHKDLHELGWFELYLLGICGKRFRKSELRLLDMVCKITSYPDARLWNNRVAALAGSARSTSTLGISGALAMTEAQLFGIQAAQMCGDFLLRAQQQLEDGKTLSEIIKREISLHKYIKGFGRPMAMAEQDERFPAILQVYQEENIELGEYVQLVLKLDQCMQEMGMPLRANYAALGAAIPLDAGLTLSQVACYLYVYMLAGIPPCYLEALERPEGCTFPISCAQVKYVGPPLKPW